MYDAAEIEAIRRRPIGPSTKGFGGRLHRGVTCAADLMARPESAADFLGTPHARLDSSALRHNVATMADYCDRHGVTLYPHGKTTMAPQVWAMQLDSGAGGITVATVPQARIARQFGVENVLIANEVVDEAAMRWLAEDRMARPDLQLFCYVDSLDGVARLDRAVRDFGTDTRMSVLLELGHLEGRTGARTIDAAAAVAAAVGRSTNLELAGVAGYEGSLVGATVDETIAAARRYLDGLRELCELLLSQGQFEGRPFLTAGGSAYFDVVVETLGDAADWDVILRSGCYVAHDSGLYSRLSPFERGDQDGLRLVAALEVRAPVLSVPEPHLAVIGVGRRDVSFDAGNPVLQRVLGANGVERPVVTTPITRMFDQHSIISLAEGTQVAVGDEVGLGVSHPCTTFDKWRWIPVTDAEGRIVDVIRTYF